MRVGGWIVGFILCSAAGLAWGAEYADAAFAPPIESKSLLEAALHPIPQQVVAGYLQHHARPHTFAFFEGQNEFLKGRQPNEPGPLMVSEGVTLDLRSPSLFATSFTDGSYQVYLAVITSVDAYMLRFLADLSALEDGDEAWIMDRTGPRAFGPYTRADHVEGGLWLATTEGDSAVLMVRTAADRLPEIRLLGLSHFYRNFHDLAKELACNINIACETDATLQQRSTGVGMLMIARGLDFALCTGCLLNNADTPEMEAYLLTANHCLSTEASTDQTEVIWDFRSSKCNSNDAPALSSLSRSRGQELLATSSALDSTFIRLDTVPSGPLGRVYLGWDRREPVVGENVVGIHHPEGTHMRISYGRVQIINEDSPTMGYENQTRVLWDDGVTEGGSSGSPLLFNDGVYRVVGNLSNGPDHVCTGDRSGNFDLFASFRDFFPSVEQFLTGTTPPTPTPTPGLCPAKIAFKDQPELLDALRKFRDRGLGKSALGKALAEAYYQAAPRLARAVNSGPDGHAMFIAIAGPFATLGRSL